MDVTFEVSGDLFTLPERQATILAEKLRLFAAGRFSEDVHKRQPRAASMLLSTDARDYHIGSFEVNV